LIDYRLVIIDYWKRPKKTAAEDADKKSKIKNQRLKIKEQNGSTALTVLSEAEG